MYVSIIGRSNVGKSSLFNSLMAVSGRRSKNLKSIVSEIKGTTIDSKKGKFYMSGNKITIVDTGGFENIINRGRESDGIQNLSGIIEKETKKQVEKSNLVLFVLDGKEGVTGLDIEMGKKLKDWIKENKKNTEIKLVINKLENQGSEKYYEELSNCLEDCYTMELGEPVAVSTHQNSGIDKLTKIIQSKVKKKDTNYLEEMAIMPEIEKEEEVEKVMETEDIEDLARYYDIEKSLRVCSTVRGSYRPNEKWVKLLNNVCGVPFVSKEEDEYIIPSLNSPAERLANLYLTDKKYLKEGENEINEYEKEELEEFKQEDYEEGENNSKFGEVEEEEEYKVKSEEEYRENEEQESLIVDNEEQGYEVNSEQKHRQSSEQEHQYRQTAEEESEYRREGKYKAKMHEENVVNPINLLVLGSKDSGRDKFLSLLAENHTEGEITDLSPNWHSFYSHWKVRVNESEVKQPVELVVSAPLNLGGSLGKMSVLQTLSLLRKCDFVLFCVNNTSEGRNTEDGTKKLVLSKREIAWLSRAVRFHKPIIIGAIVGSNYKNSKLFLNKDYPLSFEFQNIPIVTVSTKTTASDKSVRKLKRNITGLLQRGKQMIDTRTLNSWLRAFVERWPPPWKDGSKINLKFAAQVRASPPTFVLWSNVYATFPQHYLRKLKLALSEEFGLLGVPLKFVLRTTFKATPKKGRLTGLKLRRKLFN